MARHRPLSAGPPTPPDEVLLRGLRLLEALNVRQVSRLGTLAAATGLPKPTVVRLLSLLCRNGYARRLPRRRGYTLDRGVVALASGFSPQEAVVAAAPPVLEAFTRRHKWPVAIGTRDGQSMRVRAATLGISPLAASGDEGLVGRRVGFFVSALGRAYVAFCPEPERADILSLAEPRDAGRLTVDLRRAAAAGYALSMPLSGDPAVGVALPIRHEGKVLACISLRYLGRAIAQEMVVRRYLAPLQRAAADILSTAGLT